MTTYRAAAPAARLLDWVRSWVTMPAAPGLEVISRQPSEASSKPPLLFVPGLGHGAWCWDEHWLPAAAERGWPSYAVSLRGHGGSEGRDRLRTARLRDYVDDVVRVARQLPERPVLVGHSMGGLVVQHAMARARARAAVLVASLPPDNGLGTALALLRRHPTDLLEVAVGRTLPLRAEYLFSTQLGVFDAQRYRARMGPESAVAQYQCTLPRRPRGTTAPVLVLASPDDPLVPVADYARTARQYDTEPRWFPGMRHDLMLDAQWSAPLSAMLSWLDERMPAATPV